MEKVTVEGVVSKMAFLHNRGEIGFDFKWKSSLDHCLKIEPRQGHLIAFGSLAFEFLFHPKTPIALKGELIQCKISKGPCFDLYVTATAEAPKLKLSFRETDFGSVFVRQPGMSSLETTLIIQNKTRKTMHLDFFLQPPTPFLTVNQENTKIDFSLVVLL